MGSVDLGSDLWDFHQIFSWHSCLDRHIYRDLHFVSSHVFTHQPSKTVRHATNEHNTYESYDAIYAYVCIY